MELNICGHKYAIVFDEVFEKKTGAYGQHNVNTLTMTIDSSLHNSIQCSTILHEIIESLNYHHEYNLPHNVIASLANSLFQVLVENKVIPNMILSIDEDKNVYKVREVIVEEVEDDKDIKICYDDHDKEIENILKSISDWYKETKHAK